MYSCAHHDKILTAIYNGKEAQPFLTNCNRPNDLLFISAAFCVLELVICA